LFTFQSARVDIELQGRFTRGMTVCDLRLTQNTLPNTEIAMTADGPRVVDAVLQAARQSF
jgi:purine nucleosidase